MRTLDDIVQEVAACAGVIEGWPLRRTSRESGLSRRKAMAAFGECVAGMVQEHRALSPAQFSATDARRWLTLFACEPIERHSVFFAEQLERREPARAGHRPYDQMAVAFPAVSRLVAPLILGRAAAAGEVGVHAVEPVILVRKPRDTNPRPHLHVGKAGCGGTLNSLALVAHCTKKASPRCIVVGTRPLTRHQDLALSVPLALRALLEDLNRAALAERGTPAENVLALTPVVSDLLSGGGPHGRGDHNATNTELVVARTRAILSVVHERNTLNDVRQPWPPRTAVLRLPAEPLANAGPRRVAPNGLRAAGAGWSNDPHKLALEIATAQSVRRESGNIAPPFHTAFRMAAIGADWCDVPGWLTGIGRSTPVSLFARRTADGAPPTVWLTLGVPDTRHAAVVETFRSSRTQSTQGGTLLGSPFDRWVSRAYRRHAAGDLLIKGGAGEELLAGVSAAMTVGFMLFAIEHDSLG
jgi:hypothetical protein